MIKYRFTMTETQEIILKQAEQISSLSQQLHETTKQITMLATAVDRLTDIVAKNVEDIKRLK